MVTDKLRGITTGTVTGVVAAKLGSRTSVCTVDELEDVTREILQVVAVASTEPTSDVGVTNKIVPVIYALLMYM